jgi:hypothetical protein
VGVELLRDGVGRVLELLEQVGRDGEEVDARERLDLANLHARQPRTLRPGARETHVAETGAHDDRLVAVLLVVVEDLLHALHARVLLARVVAVRLGLLVPVEDAADERADERHAGLGARDGLAEAEEEREVAVDALLLELARGLDTLPGARDLDQDALLLDTLRLVERDELLRLRLRLLLVEGQARVDLGRDAAGDDLEDLRAEVNELRRGRSNGGGQRRQWRRAAEGSRSRARARSARRDAAHREGTHETVHGSARLDVDRAALGLAELDRRVDEVGVAALVCGREDKRRVRRRVLRWFSVTMQLNLQSVHALEACRRRSLKKARR